MLCVHFVILELKSIQNVGRYKFYDVKRGGLCISGDVIDGMLQPVGVMACGKVIRRCLD